MSFTPLLRRIREQKTNYRKRKALLIGKHTFAAVRVSNENVLVQVLKPSRVGDQVLASAHSRELIRYGWKGSRKNLPTCYLTGLLAGKKAKANGVQRCVLYTGSRRYSPRVAASVKGLIDAGLDVPVDEEIQPAEERIAGKHIADYANALKDDKQVYNSRFSGLIREGFAPETYADRFGELKSSILGKPAPALAKAKEEEAIKVAKDADKKTRKKVEKETSKPKARKGERKTKTKKQEGPKGGKRIKKSEGGGGGKS